MHYKRQTSLITYHINRSITITALGIIVRGTGITILVYSGLRNPVLITTFHSLGWAIVVTGSSLVLYSRLHLVLPNPKLLRILLLVILGSSVLLQTPNIVMSYISGDITSEVFIRFMAVLSRLDVIFSVQETFLSTLYIFLFTRFMRQGDSQVSKDVKRMFYFLVTVESFPIISHAILNALLFLNLYLARRMIFGFIYAVKLRIEFVVLNKFMDFKQKRQTQLQSRCPELEFRNTVPDTGRVSVLRVESKEEIPVLTQISEGKDALGAALTENNFKDEVDELERMYLGQFGKVDVV